MDRITALAAFVRLVECDNFSVVAQELGVCQSTVSKWIAKLEDDLGVRLVDRTTRAKSVSAAGKRFYDRARDVLSGYESAVAEVREEAELLRGRIRLNVPVVFGRLFVVPQLAKFLRSHPGIELDLTLNDRYVQLVEERYDLAVRVGVPVDSSLRSQVIARSTRCLVASPGYVRAHGAPQHPNELQQHQCLTLVATHQTALWQFSKGTKKHRIAVRGRVQANSSDAALSLSRAGLGVALLAAWLVEPDMRAGRLQPLLTDYQLPDAPVSVLTPPGGPPAAAVRALIAHLKERLGTALSA